MSEEKITLEAQAADAVETADASKACDAEESAQVDAASQPTSQSPRAHKRLWAAAALLCIVAIVAGTYLTYTAYKAGDFLKAVAATGTTQALFTSDLLHEYTSTGDAVASRSIVVDSSQDTCSFTFRVYNCLLDNRNIFNNKDVYATLYISVDGAGDDWAISEGSTDIKSAATGDGYLLPFPGYSATVRTFTVTFNKKYLDQARFTVKAMVDTGRSPGTNLAMLAATIVPSRRADVVKASVSGAWVDSLGKAEDYDAYNYRVTVTGKETNVKLTWENAVELDPFFTTNHPDAQVSGNTVTFTMEPGSQIVNFFRKGSGKIESWNYPDGSSRYVTASEA